MCAILDISAANQRVLLHRARAAVRGRLEEYFAASRAGAAMTCDEFVELVTAHLEGVLDDETERRVVEHLAECDGCDALWNRSATLARTSACCRRKPVRPGPRPLLAAFRDWRAA